MELTSAGYAHCGIFLICRFQILRHQRKGERRTNRTGSNGNRSAFSRLNVKTKGEIVFQPSYLPVDVQHLRL